MALRCVAYLLAFLHVTRLPVLGRAPDASLNASKHEACGRPEDCGAQEEESTLLQTRARLGAVPRVIEPEAALALAEGKEEGMVWPDCWQRYDLLSFAQESAAWCDARLVPEGRRVPAKLRGLYWLKGLPLEAVAVCFSTGEWDNSTLTLKLNIWRDFVFVDSNTGNSIVTLAYQLSLTYVITFKDAALTKADVTPTTTGGLGARLVSQVPLWLANSLVDVPIIENRGAVPGESWRRPFYAGSRRWNVQIGEYEIVRVLDGQLNIVVDNANDMYQGLYTRTAGELLIRYWDDPDDLGCANPALTDTAPIPCGTGVYVQTAKQATLAMLFFDVGPDPIPFAATSLGSHCHNTYNLLCIDGVVQVQEQTACEADQEPLIHSPSAPPGVVANWLVCSRRDPDYHLSAVAPLVDVVWDIQLSPSQAANINGCLKLVRGDAYPQLMAVHGGFQAQVDALALAKAKVGGCPTVLTEGDRTARGGDFMESGRGTTSSGGSGEGLGVWMYAVQMAQYEKAQQWARGVAPWGKQGDMVDAVSGALSEAGGLVSFIAGFKGNRTTHFRALAQVNCGMPSPYAEGPGFYRHSEVAAAASDPNQARGYMTATLPQVESCFDPTSPLFQSSGTVAHDKVRRLLDEAGFDRLTDVPLPAVSGAIPKSMARTVRDAFGNSAPSESEVGAFIVPLLLRAVWDQEAPPDVVDEVLPYLTPGKICIFGQMGEKLIKASGSTGKVARARKVMREFGSSSPRGRRLAETLQKSDYSEVRQFYEKQGSAAGQATNVTQALIGNVADAALFAGLLGTTDMATKCVQYQWDDPKHVRMFRKDPTAYLHELMRYDGAVTSFTQLFKTPQTLKMEGLDVAFPAGTPAQMAIGSANRDAKVFQDPDVFNPNRTDIGEQLAWNGRLRDVIARDYAKAPRFCPGYALSIKIATAVCQHLSQDLPDTLPAVQADTFAGLVKIIARGSPDFGKVGLITHFVGTKALSSAVKSGDLAKIGEAAYTLANGVSVFWGNWCVVEPDGGAFIGCFGTADLQQMDTIGGEVRTIADEEKRCPSWITDQLESLTNQAFSAMQADSGWWLTSLALQAILGKQAAPGSFSDDWADSYTTALYFTLRQRLGAYSWRHNDSVATPIHVGRTELFRIGDVFAPLIDIDVQFPGGDLSPEFNYDIPRVGSIFLPALTCLHNSLRGLVAPDGTFDDALDDPTRNQWDSVLSPGGVRKYRRKKDWVLSWWSDFTFADGDPMWPAPELDLAARFLQEDMWSDALERAMAFQLIGAHRVQSSPGALGVPSIVMCVKLNAYSKIPTRPSFGRFGGDMYFNTDGYPVALVTPVGDIVQRGDKNWQYWKYVWRSTLVTTITLVDHLYLTHFRVANTLARATRETLRPDHPLRRFMTVFTYGTIDVNYGAMHTLVGPNHILHRSSPVSDFNSLSESLPATLPDLLDHYKYFRNETEWQSLPAALQAAPYYADGKLLYTALRNLAVNFMNVYQGEWCNASNILVSRELEAFHDAIVAANEESMYVGTTGVEKNCAVLVERVVAALYAVTGWHRHVGTVADYYVDPDLAAFSWKEGEAHSRPRQHMILGVLAASTAMKQPRLNEDYRQVFAGVLRESEVMAVWDRYRAELGTVKQQVTDRNADRVRRGEVPNAHADPSIVETSVAV